MYQRIFFRILVCTGVTLGTMAQAASSAAMQSPSLSEGRHQRMIYSDGGNSALPKDNYRSDGYCLTSPGRCAGTPILATDAIPNFYGCDEKCFEIEECEAWTFTEHESESGGKCELFSDCNVKETDCQFCYTGTRNCHGGFGANRVSAFIGGTSSPQMETKEDEFPVQNVELLQRSGHCRPNAVADLPPGWARSGLASASVNTNIYACGGTTVDSYATSSCISYFTELTEGTWNMERPMDQARTNAAAVEAYGQLFVIGGEDEDRNPLETVEVFDYYAGEWRYSKPMTKGRSQHCAARFEDGIFVIGGLVEGEVSQSVEIFNLTTRRWEELEEPLKARMQHSCTVITKEDGRPALLVTGGTDKEGRTLSSADIFDLFTSAWSEADSLKTARASFALTVLDGRAVAVGGKSSEGADLGGAEVYSVAKDAWEVDEELELAVARSSFSAAGVSYIAGGCRR